MSDRDIVERLEEIATCSKTPLVEGIEVLHIAQTLEHHAAFEIDRLRARCEELEVALDNALTASNMRRINMDESAIEYDWAYEGPTVEELEASARATLHKARP